MTRRGCVQGIPEAVLGPVRECSVAPFVLPKEVWTLSTLTSAFSRMRLLSEVSGWCP
jgi:hypothetical protein